MGFRVRRVFWSFWTQGYFGHCVSKDKLVIPQYRLFSSVFGGNSVGTKYV